MLCIRHTILDIQIQWTLHNRQTRGVRMQLVSTLDIKKTFNKSFTLYMTLYDATHTARTHARTHAHAHRHRHRRIHIHRHTSFLKETWKCMCRGKNNSHRRNKKVLMMPWTLRGEGSPRAEEPERRLTGEESTSGNSVVIYNWQA